MEASQNSRATFSDQWAEFIAQFETWAHQDPRDTLDTLRMRYRWYSKPWALRLVVLCTEVIMARGGKGARESVPSRGTGWTTFVDIPLGDVSLDDVENAYADYTVWLDRTQEVVLSGHRVSFAYNPQNDVVTCSLTGRVEGGLNEGLTLTSYADNWVTALSLSLYKHFQLADGNWRKYAANKAVRRFG